MKKTLLVCIAGLIITGFSAMANAANVALGANVTLNGTFGASSAPKETVVDNVFLNEGRNWNIGTVWWDAHSLSGQNIVLDLGDIYKINSFTVQADNNDKYRISYYNLIDNTWKTGWDVSTTGGGGMRTRTSGLLANPITTNTLKFEAIQGDSYYSVSEIQAFGTLVSTPTPEPSSMVLGLMGLGSLLGFKRRK